MLKLLILFILTQLAYSKQTASKIHGEWESDRELTKKYLYKYAKLTEYQKKALPKFFGNSVIIFKPNGSGSVKTQAITIPKQNGEEWKIPETNIEFTYEILGEARDQLVIKIFFQEELFAESPFSLIKFEDSNTYSVSISDGISDINGREFFKRIKITKKAKSQ